MKPKSIITLIGGEQVKSPDDVRTLIANMDMLPTGGTLRLKRLTDHGSVRDCYVPAPTVVRLEELG